MSGPWEDYAKPSASAEDGPWTQYAGKTSFWEDVKIAGSQALNSIDTAIDFMNQGVVGTFTGDEQKDRVFRNMEARQAARTQAANPDQKEQTFGGKLGGAMATLPLQAAAAVTSGPQRMKEMLDQGASQGAAWRSGMTDQVVNTAAAMLPGSLGVGTAAKVGSGAALSAGAGGLSDAYSNIEGGNYDPYDLEARALDAIPGGAFGALHASSSKYEAKKAVRDRDTRKDANSIVNNLKLQEPEFGKGREYSQQGDMNFPVIDESGARNPYDVGGQVSRIQRGMETDLNTSQLGLFDQGQREIPTTAHTQDQINFEGLPPILPEEAKGQLPLPGIRAIADQTILLPDTPMIEETNARRETPLPAIDPRLADAEQRAGILSLTPDSAYPKSPDSAATDVTTGGRIPMWAMPEAVHGNLDFPLRQEFLQNPEISQAIDAFRTQAKSLEDSLDTLATKIEAETKWHQDYEGNKTEADFEKLTDLLNKKDQLEGNLQALQAEFQRGMEQMGIRNAGEAHGLNRPLYETENQGIPVKKTFDPRDTPASSSTINENIRKLGWSKKQGGGLDASIFREGHKALARALSRLTDKAWLKARFPSDKFLMNSDGTPLVMLHASLDEFDNFSRGQEGVHLGFAAAPHLRIAPKNNRDLFMRPKKNTKNKYDVETKTGSNIRPVTIRKGKYPYINRDWTSWAPEHLIMNPDFRTYLDKHAVRRMSPERWKWFRDAIMAAGGDGDQHRAARHFSHMLKEMGIDGFFYRNNFETATNTKEWTQESSPKNFFEDRNPEGRVPVKGLVNPVSFVTWEPSNIVSLFDDTQDKPAKYKINPLGHKQGGGLNPDLFGLGAAADAIAALASKWSSPLAKGNNQTEVFKKTPIGRSLEEGVFAKDVDVDAVIKETIAHGKDADKGTALIGGGAMRAEIKQHPIVFATYQWMNNAAKKADYMVREFVRPAEDAINVVLNNKNHSKIIHEIFMEELRTDKRYGEQALRDAGTPPEVVRGYLEFRNMMDQAYDAQNTALEAQGKPPLSRRQAYIASRWSGNWKAPVYVYQRGEDGQILRDKYGQPVSRLAFYIADTTKWGANGALRHMSAIMDDVDTKKSTVTFRSGRNQDRGFVDLGYHDMLKMLDDKDPRVAELQSVYEEYIESLGEVDKNQTKHHLTKSGVRGFEGDRPWVKHNKGTHRDIRDMFKQQFQYAKNAFHWSQMQEAVNKSARLFKDPAINETNPNAIAMSKEYAKNQLGYGEMAAITDLENRLAKRLGVSRSTLSAAVGAPRTLFYWTKLGFMNIPYTAVSLTQPLFSMPWHRKLSLEGYEHSAMDTYSRAIMDITALVGEDYAEYTEKQPTKEYTKIGKEAIQYAKDNGIIDINAMSDVADVGRDPRIREFENLITKNMTYSERVSRGLTFLSFVHHLDQSGKFDDHQDMFQKAEDLTNLVMTDYRVQERAPLFSRGGLTGSALSTLNTFKVNQWNQLYKLSKDAVQKKQVTPLLMLMATQFALGGAMGFYGIQTLDQLWEYFKEYSPDSWYANIKDISIKETLADLPDLFAYGGVSKLTGANLSSRYDAGTIVDPSLEGLFPFLGDQFDQANQVFKAASAAIQRSPDREQARQMATRAVLPSSMKGLYETTMANQLESEDGGVGTLRRPNDRRYTRDTGDRIAKAVGTTSLDETKAKNKLYFGEQDTKRRQERLTSVSKKFAEAVTNLDPDGMLDMAVMYNEIAEDPTAYVRLFKSIPKTQRTYLIDKLDRAHMDAKTKAGLRRLMDYVE